MSFSTCPIATIDAPIDQVWSLLGDPTQYDLWWGAQTVSVVPEGPAQPGQRISAGGRMLGRWWGFLATVQAVRVTPQKRELDYEVHFPFGMTTHNHLSCQALDGGQTRVSFG